MIVILAGEVAVTRHDELGRRELIVTHGPGNFFGELSQLSGRPALVDAFARGGRRGARHSAREAPRAARRRGRSRRAHHARADPSPGRAHRSRSGRRSSSATTSDGDVLRLANFLRRNGQPHQRLDPGDGCGRARAPRALSHRARRAADRRLPGGQLLRNPSESQLARCIGLVGPIDAAKVYDVAIVGAGPAGLATAVYAALRGALGLGARLPLVRRAGGRVGADRELPRLPDRDQRHGADGARVQSGAEVRRRHRDSRRRRRSLRDEKSNGEHRLGLANGETVRARAVVIATGARYRRLDVANLDEFEGIERSLLGVAARGASLRGTGSRSRRRRKLGGPGGRLPRERREEGLAARARRPLAATMSRYLVDRIGGLPNVEVVTPAEVTRLEGRDGIARGRALAARRRGRRRRAVQHIFLFIGAEPNTDWLAGSGVALDAKGFVRTGAEIGVGYRALETNRLGRVRDRRRARGLGQASRRRGRRGGAGRRDLARFARRGGRHDVRRALRPSVGSDRAAASRGR